MPQSPLPYPIGGLNDNYSHDEQPPMTTRDAQNERAKDPVTNRIRGGQRAGFTAHSEAALAAGPVRALVQVTYDARQTDFSDAVTNSAGDLADWSTALPSGVTPLNIKHDSQGAKYVLDGSTLHKYNRDGVLVFSFTLPVQEEGQIARALVIDEFDIIYVGVSSGGTQATAWIRCYQPDEEKNLVKRWEILPGAYCERLTLKDDKLYAALNYADSGRSEFVAYENLIAGSGPDVALRREVGYPINDIDVDDKGNVFTAHSWRQGWGVGATDKRYYDPRLENHTSVFRAQRWDPTKLDQWDRRKWVWLSAADLKLSNGDDVEEWKDTRGRGVLRFSKDVRTISGGSLDGLEYIAPRYKSFGLGGQPSVQLDGNRYRLISDPSVGDLASANDSSPMLFPNRKGYLIVAVVQFGEDSSKKGRLWQQENSNSATTGTGANACYLNTASTNAYDGSGTGTAGAISVPFEERGSGTGTLDPFTTNKNGFATNTLGAAIITVLLDANSGGTGYQASYFRVNGATVNKWLGINTWSALDVLAVLGCKDDGTFGPSVSISELLVVQQYTDPADNIAKVATIPDVNMHSSADYTGSHDDSVSDTEVERIEGYFAWKYGISHLLDDGADTTAGPDWSTSGPSSRILHPFTSRSTADTAADPTFAPPNPNGRGADTIDRDLLRDQGQTVKWAPPLGECKWVAYGGGMGYAVRLNSVGEFYTVGQRQRNDSGTVSTSGTNAAAVRKLADNGSSVASRWSYYIFDTGALTQDYNYSYPIIDVDEYDNVYVPWNGPKIFAGTRYSLVALTAAGDVVASLAQPFLAYQANTGTVRDGTCVSIDPRQPDYTGNVSTVTRPELVALGVEVSGSAQTSVQAVRLVNASPNDAAPRAVQYLGVSSGAIVRFAHGSVQTVGSGALAPNARYVSAVNAFGKAYFTDGINYRVYDPRTGVVSRWTAEDGGSIVPRYKLLTFWRGRMVLARGDEDPQNWQMSEAGNPNGWNFFPPDSPLATQAVIGNEAQIGRVPDVITTVIPYDRERLIIGCDHTVYMMWGDPMENGTLVLASDVTGMAFGSSWAKDAEGLVYFFGQRGGVYAMSPGGEIRKLTTDTIDRRMQDVDLAAFNPTLVWDEDLRELRVFMCARTTGSITAAHWAWSKQTNSWHQDKFSAAGIQPTCATVFDSDSPDDRVTVIGCEDGWVRRVNRNAASDDGRTIDSWVTIGPFATPEGALRLRDPRVTLADDQGGCWLELGSGATPDAAFAPQDSVELYPGDNPTRRIGVRGNYCWVRLRNAAPGMRWAYERGTIDAYPAGRRWSLYG
jgi:hypothetical protein